jgi:hypothetical protein
MEDHLKQMRNKYMDNKTVHEMKRKQEMDFLNQVKQLEELEQQRKIAS